MNFIRSGMANESLKYRICWGRHTSNTLECINRYLTSEYLTDMILSGNGYTIKCHRLLLAASSFYFERLFTFYNSTSDLVVVLKDFTYEDMVNVLDYIYHGTITIDQSLVPRFLKIAESLELKGIIGDQQGHAAGQSTSTAATASSDPQPENLSLVKVFSAPIQPVATGSAALPENNNNMAQQRSFHIGSSPSTTIKRKRQRNKPTAAINVNTLKQSNEMEENAHKKPESVVASGYKKYSNEKFTAAIEAIKGGMSCFKAGKMYNIPTRTLYERRRKFGIPNTDAETASLAIKDKEQEKLVDQSSNNKIPIEKQIAACIPEDEQRKCYERQSEPMNLKTSGRKPFKNVSVPLKVEVKNERPRINSCAFGLENQHEQSEEDFSQSESPQSPEKEGPCPTQIKLTAVEFNPDP